MEHILDNPAYNALISGNQYLAQGNGFVKFFSKDVSPFVGFKSEAEDPFEMLHSITPYDGPFGIFSTEPLNIPIRWKLIQIVPVYQMVHNNEIKSPLNSNGLLPLKAEHIDQAVALTKLTNPGPFNVGTTEFGHYFGIFENNKLVAMAGQRLHPFQFAEISAVCTHPDYRGQGFAKRLINFHLHRIMESQQTAFLHVKTDQTSTIHLYEKLGFSTRSAMYVTIIKKEGE